MQRVAPLAIASLVVAGWACLVVRSRRVAAVAAAAASANRRGGGDRSGNGGNSGGACGEKNTAPRRGRLGRRRRPRVKVGGGDSSNINGKTTADDRIPTHSGGTWVTAIAPFDPATAVPSRTKVSAETHPHWDGETPVVVFVLAAPRGTYDDTTASTAALPAARVYAISDLCPHVAIGRLSEGDAVDLGDMEDLRTAGCASLPVVDCPVHAYVFDLRSGHCITDRRGRTPPAPVYPTRTAVVGGQRVLQVCSKPRAPVPENTVSVEAGNKAQLHLVARAMDRKFGAAEDA